jgi:monovalent cation/hydrogen antiporter
LTLPLVIRGLGLEEDGIEDREDAEARIRAAEAAIARLAELEQEEWVREDTAERMRGLYNFRATRFRARFEDDAAAVEQRSRDYQRLRRALLDAERDAVLELRRTGAISNDVWLRVTRDLDLEDQRLDI